MVSGRHRDTSSDIPSREAEEDPTVGTSALLSIKGLSTRHTYVARYVGKASASTRAIRQAPWHYRVLQFLINSVVSESLSQTE